MGSIGRDPVIGIGRGEKGDGYDNYDIELADPLADPLDSFTIKKN